MADGNKSGWRLEKQINLSMVVQLILLASLIVGSWANLQRQLDLMQKDVAMLLKNQKKIRQKLDSLQLKSISYEYRLRAMEKCISRFEERENFPEKQK